MGNLHNFVENIDWNDFQTFNLKSPGWTGNKDENDFLQFLLNYVHNNESHSITSEKISYEYREFKKSYLHLLSNKVVQYATENYIDSQVNVDCTDIFTQSSCVLKIKNKFYLIQSMVGQGSLVYFEYLKDSNYQSYVDYDLMMKGEMSPNYKKDIERTLYTELDRLKSGLNVTDELFVQLINKYAQNSLEEL